MILFRYTTNDIKYSVINRDLWYGVYGVYARWMWYWMTGAGQPSFSFSKNQNGDDRIYFEQDVTRFTVKCNKIWHICMYYILITTPCLQM